MKRLLLLALVAAPPAFAQDTNDEIVDGVHVRHPKETRVDFDEMRVEAGLQGPHIADVSEARRAAFNPLIRLRLDFDDAMEASVDDVK